MYIWCKQLFFFYVREIFNRLPRKLGGGNPGSGGFLPTKTPSCSHRKLRNRVYPRCFQETWPFPASFLPKGMVVRLLFVSSSAVGPVAKPGSAILWSPAVGRTGPYPSCCCPFRCPCQLWRSCLARPFPSSAELGSVCPSFMQEPCCP